MGWPFCSPLLQLAFHTWSGLVLRGSIMSWWSIFLGLALRTYSTTVAESSRWRLCSCLLIKWWLQNPFVFERFIVPVHLWAQFVVNDNMIVLSLLCILLVLTHSLFMFQINRVEYMHQKGFLHRDIKPDNFLMGLGRKANQVRSYICA